MLSEALECICAAEEEAKQRLREAHQKALESIGSAENAGEKTVAKTLERAESEIAHLTRSTEIKVTEEARELASKTANRQATIRARAERRLEASVKYIVERIVIT